MGGRAFVSRFSPNRTDPEVLEAIFVQRHRLAEVWLERLRDSVLTRVKHHLLAIGPRGCGKSHLVALLLGRLRKDPAVCERVRIAWLPEDETTPSFWKFLLRILRALNAEYGDEFPPPSREELANVTEDRRSAVLTDYLLNKLDGRSLLVVVENLDDVLRGLKEEGQKRWRAFLQEHAVATTLATSQQLSEDVSDRDRPFFNFFQLEHLRPLTADEALDLLRKIADHTGKSELAAFLLTPTGRARVRAIRHLAGGSHRVFIILSEFATREKLNDLVTAFEELLDELTPYYQERLRWLPDQQREIIEFLCRQARTVPVKEIAAELFMTEQTAAAQLKSLKDKGYAMAGTRGRESRYELAEPLMRLCVEVKDPQGEPIRLIVEFLCIWYDRAGAEARLQGLPPDADLERRYFHAVLQTQRPDVLSPVEVALNRDLEAARATGDVEEVVRLLVELAATADSVERCQAVARELQDLGQSMEAQAALERNLVLCPNDANLWHTKGRWLNAVGLHMEALAAYDKAIELDPQDAIAWYNKGCALYGLGQYEEALKAWDRVVALDPDNTRAWCWRGVILEALGEIAEALPAYDRAIELDPKSTVAWNNKAYALIRLRRFAEALAASDRAIEAEPTYAPAWINKGCVLNKFCRFGEALAAFDRATELEPNNPYAWKYRGQSKLRLAQIGGAVLDFRHAIELNGNYFPAFDCLAEAHALQGDWDEAERVLAQRFRLPPSPDNSPRPGNLPDLIAAIFRASLDRGVWAHRVDRLLDLAGDVRAELQTKAEEKATVDPPPANGAESLHPPNPVAILGDSLVRSLTTKPYAEATADALDAWTDVWQETTERHPDLSLAVRMFGVGIQYLQSKDERVLLDLVQEERAILRDLFGLESETEES